MKNLPLVIIIILVLSLGISGCILEAQYQPPAIPVILTVNVDREGNPSVNIGLVHSVITPWGTFSASASIDPAQYLPVSAVHNTLIVRLNGQDYVYDLNGQQVEVQFQSGYYKQILLQSDGTNWLLVLETDDIPTVQPTMTPSVVPAPTQTVEFVVLSTHDRNYTNIYINQGQRVVIEYLSGEWRAGPLPTWPLHGPEGDPQTPSKRTFPIHDAPIMSLVVGIGDEVIDVVGRHWSHESQWSGNLWLGANDDDFDDNFGSLTVRITIIP